MSIFNEDLDEVNTYNNTLDSSLNNITKNYSLSNLNSNQNDSEFAAIS